MPNVVEFRYRDDGSKADWFDRAICQRFEIQFDDRSWAWGWYNSVGLALARRPGTRQESEAKTMPASYAKLHGCHANKHVDCAAQHVLGFIQVERPTP